MGWRRTWNRRLGEQGFGGGVGRRYGWDAQDPSEKLAHAMEQCEGVATGGGIQRTFLFFGHDMQGIGAQPGTEPVPPAVEAWHLNHWTAREVPGLSFQCGETREVKG